MDEHDEREAGVVRLDDPWRDDTVSGDVHRTDTPGPPEPRARGPFAGAGARVVAQVPRPAGRPGPSGANASGEEPKGAGPHGADSVSAVYLEVHGSPAFREVRSRYRRFVLPASVLFLGWYFAYVVASTAAPEFMARPVAGTLNVALLAGLGQFATTFLLTWAYVRHARLRRDRAAMDLRWAVYEQNRQTAHEENRPDVHEQNRQHGHAGRGQER